MTVLVSGEGTRTVHQETYQVPWRLVKLDAAAIGDIAPRADPELPGRYWTPDAADHDDAVVSVRTETVPVGVHISSFRELPRGNAGDRTPSSTFAGRDRHHACHPHGPEKETTFAPACFQAMQL